MILCKHNDFSAAIQVIPLLADRRTSGQVREGKSRLFFCYFAVSLQCISQKFSAMKNQIDTSSRKSNALLLVAQIFASLLALFFLLAFVPKLIDEYVQAFTGEKPFFDGWEGLIMEATFYLYIIGYLFSWWKKCTGGIIILVASAVQMGPFLIIEGNLGSLIFGIPMLIAGILFLLVYKK